MADVAMLLDPTKCTACRGCQAACKLWNQRGFVPTFNTGTYENPPTLGKDVWRRIVYIEQGEGYDMKWLFRQEQCFHCTNATCVTACPTGALSYRGKGIVYLDQAKCIGCRFCEQTCPFSVPKYNPVTKTAWKCNLCADRIDNGMQTSCSKACPTGAIEFSWNRQDLVAKAKAKAAKTGMRLYGAEIGELGLHVMHLLPADAAVAYRLPDKPGVPPAVFAWKNVLKPLAKWGIGLGVAAAAFHYLTIGPNEVDEGGDH